MSLEKLICTQCGSNQIKVVSATVFECESCGTLLKEDEPAVATQNAPKEKPFRSKRIQYGLEDQPDFSVDANNNYEDAGNNFIKQIFWLGIAAGAVALIAWLFSL
jgi:hypothetical protein